MLIVPKQLNDPLNHLGRFELIRSNQLEAIITGRRSCEDEEIVNLAILNSYRSFYAKGDLFSSDRLGVTVHQRTSY